MPALVQCTLVLLLSLLNSASPLRLSIEPLNQHVKSSVVSNFVVMCQASEPLVGCQYKIYENRYKREMPIFDLSAENVTDEERAAMLPRLYGRISWYNYTGTGLARGQCGLNVTATASGGDKQWIVGCRVKAARGGAWISQEASVYGNDQKTFTITRPTNRLIALPGDSLSLLFTGEELLTYCHFQLPITGLDLNFDKGLDSAATSLYHYHGESLIVGQCGIMMHRLNEQRNGWLQVIYRTKTDTLEWINTAIIVAKPPESLELKLKADNMTENSTVLAICTVKNSRPLPRISWFIGNDLIRQDDMDDIPSDDWKWPHETQSITQVITIKLSKQHNKKDIKCMVEHISLNYAMLAMETIKFQYEPLSSPILFRSEVEQQLENTPPEENYLSLYRNDDLNKFDCNEMAMFMFEKYLYQYDKHTEENNTETDRSENTIMSGDLLTNLPPDEINLTYDPDIDVRFNQENTSKFSQNISEFCDNVNSSESTATSITSDHISENNIPIFEVNYKHNVAYPKLETEDISVNVSEYIDNSTHMEEDMIFSTSDDYKQVNKPLQSISDVLNNSTNKDEDLNFNTLYDYEQENKTTHIGNDDSNSTNGEDLPFTISFDYKQGSKTSQNISDDTNNSTIRGENITLITTDAIQPFDNLPKHEVNQNINNEQYPKCEGITKTSLLENDEFNNGVQRSENTIVTTPNITGCTTNLPPYVEEQLDNFDIDFKSNQDISVSPNTNELTPDDESEYKNIETDGVVPQYNTYFKTDSKNIERLCQDEPDMNLLVDELGEISEPMHQCEDTTLPDTNIIDEVSPE